MADNVTAINGGRRMTPRLAAWLDNVDNRKLKIRVLERYAGESEGWLKDLLSAIALELQLVQYREDETIRRYAQDRRDEIDRLDTHPWPQPPKTGRTVWWDPQTNTFSDEPPDSAA